MTIPEQILQEWKGLRSKGDNKEILKALNKPDTSGNNSAISRAFKRGTCTDAMFTALNSFYSQKKISVFTVKTDKDGK